MPNVKGYRIYSTNGEPPKVLVLCPCLPSGAPVHLQQPLYTVICAVCQEGYDLLRTRLDGVAYSKVALQNLPYMVWTSRQDVEHVRVYQELPQTGQEAGKPVENRRIQPGRYRHYKGQYYQVIGEAEQTETGETFVIYIPLYVIGSDRLRARPRSQWEESVAWEGTTVQRFVRVEDSEPTEVDDAESYVGNLENQAGQNPAFLAPADEAVGNEGRIETQSGESEPKPLEFYLAWTYPGDVLRQIHVVIRGGSAICGYTGILQAASGDRISFTSKAFCLECATRWFDQVNWAQPE